MRRYAWIGTAVLLVILLVLVELTIITKASGYENTEKGKERLVFTKAHIAKNTAITADMLELVEVDRTAVNPDAVKSINAVGSKRANADIAAGEMLMNTMLSADECGIIEAEDKSKRLFSLEFDAHQANGWQLAEDQFVDIIYVPNHSQELKISTPNERGGERLNQSSGGAAAEENEVNEAAEADEAAEILEQVPLGVRVIKNIRIAGLIDDHGKIVDALKSKNAPRYISFEVTEEQAIFLAYAKGKGRLELSCIPGR